MPTFENAKILFVDDEHVNIVLLERILQRAGYTQLQSTTDSRRALELFDTFGPDLVLTDLHVPHLDGITLLQRLRERIPPDAYLPMIMLTADMNPETEARALQSGANDFINKPFRASQIALRIHNLLQTRKLHLELKNQNVHLETRVRERTRELDIARIDALQRLAMAAEYRDHDTAQHTERVGYLSARIAEASGMSADRVELLRRAAPLHDIGKIGIPDSILLKPGRLSRESSIG